MNIYFLALTSEESPDVSADGSKAAVKDDPQASQTVAQKGKMKKGDQEEVHIEVTAKLGVIGVTVTSLEGDLSHIIVGGRCQSF